MNTSSEESYRVNYHDRRIIKFYDAFHDSKIDVASLRKLCFNGCPHERGIRCIAWKILLNYLPTEINQWDKLMQKQRQTYEQFIDALILQPGTKKYEETRSDVTMDDHPLNANPKSEWNQYFEDNAMLQQIDKDCRRLYPDLSFFQTATLHPVSRLMQEECRSDGDKEHFENLRTRVEMSFLQSETVGRDYNGVKRIDMKYKPLKVIQDYSPLGRGKEAHWEVVERILFLYSKLNIGIGYVQGMNEIIGPIYYTFSSDPTHKEHAEADAFWCFTALMSQIRDNFIKTLDQSESEYLMSQMMHRLQRADTALYLLLEEQDIKPEYFAFRWITLLLSQEFPLPDVLTLWDALFSSTKLLPFLINICVAMLLQQKEGILQLQKKAGGKVYLKKRERMAKKRL